jgi:Spy/CpxP family protein refolding chaperone
MLKKLLTVTFIIMIAWGLMGFAGCRHSSPVAQAAFMVDYLSEMLDLTENQQVLLKQYVKDVFQKAMALRNDRIRVRQAVIGQFKNESMDQQAILTLIAQYKKGQDAFTALVIQRISGFHQMLTPEQRTKLLKKMEDSRAFRKARMEKLTDYFQNQP